LILCQLNLTKVYFFNCIDNGVLLSQILAERCDGNRNLLHACVSVCAPISNKELEGIENILSINSKCLSIMCVFFCNTYRRG